MRQFCTENHDGGFFQVASATGHWPNAGDAFDLAARQIAKSVKRDPLLIAGWLDTTEGEYFATDVELALLDGFSLDQAIHIALGQWMTISAGKMLTGIERSIDAYNARMNAA